MHEPTLAWVVGIPVLFVLQFALTAGISLFLASATVFFRDLEHIVEVLLNLLFYATPIIYAAGQIPHGYRWILWVNPLAPLAQGWRTVLLDGDLPGRDLLGTLALAAASIAIGWFTFRRTEDALADAI